MVTQAEQSPLIKTEREAALVLWFDEVGIKDVTLVGGKNASLGEMFQLLSPQGVRVLNGFATTAYAYRQFIQSAGLENKLRPLFVGLKVDDLNRLHEVGRQARLLMLEAPFSAELKKAIGDAYQRLCQQYGPNTDVAVRSSATAEDLPEASFAGQQESYLNVRGVEGVLEALKKCFASMFTDRAIHYRQSKGSITSAALSPPAYKRWSDPTWRLQE